jgi:dienelactone hydrolase
VVFSPGLGAIGQATRYLERHLASHGYIVICPTHAGSDWLAMVRRTPLAAFSRKELLVRVSEVMLAVELLRTGRLPSHICQRADSDRVALIGHSYGALTIQAVAGVPVLDPFGQEIPLMDARFKAFVCMSPYGDSYPAQRLGMTQQGYAKIDRPILFMSGDRDDLWTVGRGPNTHLGPYRWVSTPDRFHLLLGDTKHSDFSEVLGRVKKRTAIMVNSTATAFLDCYLNDNAEAREYLRSDLPVAASRYQSWAFLGGERRVTDDRPG